MDFFLLFCKLCRQIRRNPMRKITVLLFVYIFLNILNINALEYEIYDSSDTASYLVAREIVDLVKSKENQPVVLGLATGGTMTSVYSHLKNIIKEECLDLSHVITFNLDEYLDLPLSDPESYHSFMFTNLFETILYSEQNPKGIKRENIHFPNEQDVDLYDKMIESYGNIDLQLLGIGRNGHIGFSEPGTPFDSTTFVVELHQTTREDNARFFGGDVNNVPKKAVTMGIKTIIEAKKIILLAFGDSKKEAVKNAINGEISTDIPASILQKHHNTKFMLDKDAAQLLQNQETIHLFNGKFLKDGKIQPGELWIQNGKFVSEKNNCEIQIDLNGNIVAPGFIDLQINGAFGCDFSRNPEQIEEAAKGLLQYGVTAFLPTVVSSTPETYSKILKKLQPRSYGSSGAEILGIHLEGPYFSSQYGGAHDQFVLQDHYLNDINSIYGDLEGVKIVTLAPEITNGISLINELSARGIVVSMGHSAATYVEALNGIEAGALLATHLFNAMTPYHHRNPGIIGAALIEPKLNYSIIVDGFHLCPETVKLCYQLNPQGLILVTDATEALGLKDGIYHLGNKCTEVLGNKIYIAGSSTIAGSNISMNMALKNLIIFTGCAIEEALEAASKKPAQLIGIYPTKGSLEVGADADFVVLSDSLDVIETYIGGELSFQQGG